ncbi:hypothetical protein E0W68_02710 [Flavobacterium salilacus subsp. salilacus]|uniref:hypothetical protein n=1 Tax=Flavobacterium TaxID=237 RepID=UPI0010758A16|nr:MULTISPECIES: hypothetical protein [Flavobacterium]KAF2520152.1 hypothetical protein E0W68_02710 [Flavobacterium salilacus subsp. salilacus]MBE1613931.1 hypothetical protein [Flavobacterium sp. SaA2.13]
MKQLFLLLSLSILTLSISSCSDDDSNSTDDNTTSFVKFKVDGVQKTFNHVIINTGTPEDGTVLLTIIASESENSEESISFEIYQGETGGEEVDVKWLYELGNKVYDEGGYNDEELIQIDHIVQKNNIEKLSGTFSGELSRYDIQQGLYLLEITEGTFNIKR